MKTLLHFLVILGFSVAFGTVDKRIELIRRTTVQLNVEQQDFIRLEEYKYQGTLVQYLGFLRGKSTRNLKFIGPSRYKVWQNALKDLTTTIKSERSCSHPLFRILDEGGAYKKNVVVCSNQQNHVQKQRLIATVNEMVNFLKASP